MMTMSRNHVLHCASFFVTETGIKAGLTPPALSALTLASLQNHAKYGTCYIKMSYIKQKKGAL